MICFATLLNALAQGWPLMVLAGVIGVGVLLMRLGDPERAPRTRMKRRTPARRVRPEFRLSTLANAVIARWPWLEVCADAGCLTVKRKFRSARVLDADAIRELVSVPHARSRHQLVAITRGGARLTCSRPMRSEASVDELARALARALRMPGTSGRRLVSASK